MGMRPLPLAFVLCAACSPAEQQDSNPSAPPARRFATQTEAAPPDYRALLKARAVTGAGARVWEATRPLPSDAAAVGALWVARLKARGALLGTGLAGKGSDGPVALIDTGLTESEFTRWAAQNRWPIPRHIRWSFVPEMKLPPVGERAEQAIRVWPGATTRTGMQNQALFHGKVELRNGCFFMGMAGQPVDKLAWFHAEVGLDVDQAGYFILRDRIDGSILARVGEELSWGGPATADIDDGTRQALHRACGTGEIHVVGSPQSSERFMTQYPHLRTPSPPPPPPKVAR